MTSLKYQRMVFIGDSITDCYRKYPIGNNYNNGLGNGYVSLINSHLKLKFTDNNFQLYNMGISGNRITDLELRWNKDVVELEPDFLSIFIGINDVWRHFDIILHDDQVSLAKYKSIYSKLIQQSLNSINNILIISPYYLTDIENPIRKMMDAYRQATENIAEKFDLSYVDLQKHFDKLLKDTSSNELSDDNVHLSQTGHRLIAENIIPYLLNPN